LSLLHGLKLARKSIVSAVDPFAQRAVLRLIKWSITPAAPAAGVSVEVSSLLTFLKIYLFKINGI
jgi:hypothetical protein